MNTSHNGNGNGNGMGSGSGTMGRLLRIREQRAQELAAIDVTIALLTDTATATKRGRAASVLDEAIALDAARVGKRGPYKKHASGKAEVRANRERSAVFLQQFNPDTPTRPTTNAQSVAPLLYHGYLKRQGDGYLRTAKAFVIDAARGAAPATTLDEAIAARVGKPKPSAAKRAGNKAAARAARERSAAVLKQFHRDKPTRAPNLGGISPLLLHGYLKRKGDGYIRTGKAFVIDRP
jgi:hypothetical protein